DCYTSSIKTIDQMGEFIDDHRRRAGTAAFGGEAVTASVDREAVAAELLPFLRGIVSSNRRVVAHWDQSQDALTFAGSRWAEELSALGTSCPDHFLRTRICPMFVAWDPSTEAASVLHERLRTRASEYRDAYGAYYRSFADQDSP